MTTSIEYRNQVNATCYDFIMECLTQVQKANESLINFDTDLAEEVMNIENHINSLNLKIDKDCELFLALHNPVAVDLRFITAIKNINTELERIGDHAYGIAQYIAEKEVKVSKEIISALGYDKMFDIVMDMFQNIIDAYENKDVKIARKVFKKDKKVNKIYFNAYEKIEELIKKDINTTKQCLIMFAVLKKIEQIGDLLKNIAGDIIFYIDATVMKHKKKK